MKHFTIATGRIELVQGDITAQDTDLSTYERRAGVLFGTP